MNEAKRPKSSVNIADLAKALEAQRTQETKNALAASNAAMNTEWKKIVEAAKASTIALESKRELLADYQRLFSSKETLNAEIQQLRKKIGEATSELEGVRQKGEQSKAKVAELETLVDELRVKEDLGFLLTRVNAQAQNRLIEDEGFRALFAEDRDCSAFVMSVDIRRSTELMLKARTPSAFAEFISRLTRELYECVVRNFGVFDKFTGDGILAFFPEEFSGQDAAYAVVKTAAECHEIFNRIYRSSRGSFTSVLTGVGLGIGIDYGTVRLLRVAEGLTVVGVPVVYACRMSGANPGQTLLNQPAFELVSTSFGKNVVLSEVSLEIKHEGSILAYEAKMSNDAHKPCVPNWCA